MTEQQQELYDKLLKKVNEYCLGQAAEDGIEAIDNLVDTYETPKVDTATIENYRKRMKEWQSGHSVDFSKVRFEVQNLLPDPDDIGKRLKALETIKKCFDVNGFDELIPNHFWWVKSPKHRNKFLKEVLK